MRKLGLALVCLVALTFTGQHMSYSQSFSCPGPLQTRLAVTMQGRVIQQPSTIVYIRATMGKNGKFIGQIKSGDTFTVLEGPLCADGFVWFHISTSTGLDGWLIEASTTRYFIEPVTDTSTSPTAAPTNASVNSTNVMTSDQVAKQSLIAFISNRNGVQFQVYLMRPDGTDVTRLEYDGVQSAQPVWSPDGTKIAFVTRTDPYNQIMVMNADGSNLVNVSDGNLAQASDPAWSPDSQKIVFSGEDGQHTKHLYVANADGSGLKQITKNGKSISYETQPTWMPDGKSILYVNGDMFGPIVQINVDGSNPQVLIPDKTERPKWSPDGKSLAFIVPAPEGDVIAVKSSGAPIALPLTDKIHIQDFSWSPDGQSMAITYSGLDLADSQPKIGIIALTANEITPLFSDNTFNTLVNWSPLLSQNTMTAFASMAQKQANTQTQSNVQTVSIVVASKALPYGTLLTAGDVMLCSWPKAWAPDQADERLDNLPGQIMEAETPANVPIVGRSLMTIREAQSINVVGKPSPDGPLAACPHDLTKGAPVVTVVQTITRGATIPAAALAISTYPQDAVPADAFTAIDQVANKKACAALYPETPVVKSQIGTCS